MTKIKFTNVPYFPGFLFIFSSILSSCSGDDEGARELQRSIKYEITGNFTGKIVVVYTNAIGETEYDSNQSLPWSKELNLETAHTAAFGAQSSVVGSPGQTATAKIIVNGEVKRTQTSTANEQGHITFPNLVYTFQ